MRVNFTPIKKSDIFNFRLCLLLDFYASLALNLSPCPASRIVRSTHILVVRALIVIVCASSKRKKKLNRLDCIRAYCRWCKRPDCKANAHKKWQSRHYLKINYFFIGFNLQKVRRFGLLSLGCLLSSCPLNSLAFVLPFCFVVQSCVLTSPVPPVSKLNVIL